MREFCVEVVQPEMARGSCLTVLVVPHLKAPRRISLSAGSMHAENNEVGGYGLKYGAACTRRTSRQQVEVESAIPKKYQSVYTFCSLDP